MDNNISWDQPEPDKGIIWDQKADDIKWDQPATDYKAMSEEETQKLLKRNPTPPSALDKAIQGASMIPGVGPLVSSGEVAANMVAGIPAAAAQVVAAGKTVLGGDLSKPAFEKGSQEMTPQWMVDAAQGTAPRSETGKTAIEGLSKAMDYSGTAGAVVGASVVGGIQAAVHGEGTSGARERATKITEEIKPFMDEAINALMIGEPMARSVKKVYSIMRDNGIAKDQAAKILQDSANYGKQEATKTPVPDTGELPKLNPEYNIPKSPEEAQAQFKEASDAARPLTDIYDRMPGEEPLPDITWDDVTTPKDTPHPVYDKNGMVTPEGGAESPYMSAEETRQANVDNSYSPDRSLDAGTSEMQLGGKAAALQGPQRSLGGKQGGQINPDVFSEGFKKIKEMVIGGKKLQFVAEHSPADSMNPKGNLIVRVNDPEGNRIASSWFSPDNPYDLFPDLKLKSKSVGVDPAYQKQGIATEMYKFAHELGNDVAPNGSQTKAGQALWQSINRQGGLGGKQGGSLNVGGIADGLFGSKEKPVGIRAFLDKIVSPFTDIHEAMSMAAADGHGDIGGGLLSKVAQNFPTMNQVKNILTHPVLTFAYTHMREVSGQVHMADKTLEAQFKPFFKASRKIQLTISHGLTKLQTPEFKDGLVNGQWPDALLKKVGLGDKEIALYRQLEPGTEALLKRDTESAARMGRVLPAVGGYWPISHGGQFVIKLRNADGNLTHVLGFDDFDTAKKTEKALQADPNAKGITIEPVSPRSGSGEFSDTYNDWMLSRNLPDWAQNIADKAEVNRAQAQATFEIARTGIKGFIGEQLHPEGMFPNKENTRLLDVFYKRLKASSQFDTRSSLFKDIVSPVMDSDYFANKPNLYNLMIPWFNKQMGHDISLFKPLDNVIQSSLELAHKPVQLTKALWGGYEPSLDQHSLTPRAAKDASRVATMAASVFHLSGNMMNVAQNGVNFLMTLSWIGPADAMKLGANPVQAWAWNAEALFGTTFGILSKSSRDNLSHFWKSGDINPHSWDDSPLIRDQRGLYGVNIGDSQIHVPGPIRMAKFVGSTIVESGNNAIHLAYYKRMVDIAERNGVKFESPEHKNQTILEFTKSATGDYNQIATRLLNDKTGVIGSFTKNFQTWTWNQIGREMANLNNVAKESGNIGILRAAAPVLAFLTFGTLYMGLKGMPGAVDYEQSRRSIKNIFNIDLKPIDLALKEMGVPESLRGSYMLETALPTLTGTDADKWPALTQGQNFAQVTQAPLVVSDMVSSVLGKLVPALLRGADDKYNTGLFTPRGNTQAQTLTALQGIPKIIRPAIEKRMAEVPRPGDTQYPVNVLGGSALPKYKQSPYEASLNHIGMITNRQDQERTDNASMHWEQAHLSQKVKDLEAAIVSQAITGNLDGMKSNLETLAKPPYGTDLSKSLSDRVLNAKTKEVLTPQEEMLREMLKANKSGQTGKVLQLFEAYKAGTR